ncbi:unnamed protein product [Calypogeia fissa]
MALVSSKSVLAKIGGGVGPLPELKRSECHCSSFLSGNSVHSRVLRQRNSSVRAVSSKERKVVVSQLQDEDSSKTNTRVFKSMQDAVERREAEAAEAAIASFDAADIARAIADAELLARAASRGGRAVQPPRFATLRAFGTAGGQGVVTRGLKGTSVFELIAANIEASKQVKNWEVLSGRLAMLAICVALGMELFTGNSVFKGIDIQKLEAVAALCAVATVSAGGFAFAWRAKSDIAELMAKGSKNMFESALDSLIDGLFFDEA